MRAMQVTEQVTGSKNGLILTPAEVARPVPTADEVLVRVCAAGVTPTELLWYPTTHTTAGEPRLAAIPGHEFSGVVELAGENVKGFAAGDAVYGINDWFADGATAEFCVTRPEWIAAKPAVLSHGEAATVPIGALTAWQGLFFKAKLQAGERILIHGGSGAVGLFAVQLAARHGATVIATASKHNAALVQQLGAATVVDYRSERFEDYAKDVDVVFDTVGGETLQRSWTALRPQGRMVTIAADAEGQSEPRVKEAFFIVEANGAQLLEIGKMLDAGSLRTFINASVPLEQAPLAYANEAPNRQGFGKTVIEIVNA